MAKKDTSFQGFALPHFADEIALRPEFCALFGALKQQGALSARDLVQVLGFIMDETRMIFTARVENQIERQCFASGERATAKNRLAP